MNAVPDSPRPQSDGLHQTGQAMVEYVVLCFACVAALWVPWGEPPLHAWGHIQKALVDALQVLAQLLARAE